MDSCRRLSLLTSHLLPPAIPPFSPISLSNCVSNDGKHRPQDECVFCNIVLGQTPAFKLYEDDSCICILDSNPLSHGHSLIIPKSHFPSLEVTPPSVVAAMCSKVPFIGNALMKATDSDSFNLLVNNGAAAGQTIFHTHIHIIPRKEQDCLWTTESLPRNFISSAKEASQLVNRVREHLSTVFEDGKVQESTLSRL